MFAAIDRWVLHSAFFFLAESMSDVIVFVKLSLLLLII
jgi:hypothetical protein